VQLQVVATQLDGLDMHPVFGYIVRSVALTIEAKAMNAAAVRYMLDVFGLVLKEIVLSFVLKELEEIVLLV